MKFTFSKTLISKLLSFCMLLLLASNAIGNELILPATFNSQKITTIENFTKLLEEDSLREEVITLANQLISDKGLSKNIEQLFTLHLLSEQYYQAGKNLHHILNAAKEMDNGEFNLNYPYKLYLEALEVQTKQKQTFVAAYTKVFKQKFTTMDAKVVFKMFKGFNYNIERRKSKLFSKIKQIKNDFIFTKDDAMEILSIYRIYKVFSQINRLTNTLIAEDRANRYHIDTDVLIKTKEGITHSAIVVRSKEVNTPYPSALQFTIYPYAWNLASAINAVNHGYVGIVVDTRGKRLSPDSVAPYENDAQDAYQVIDWISKQEFSDGRVAMYGGSYGGFTQWAAAKTLHPALKTIVPSVANHPMQGMPMENGVVITPNIQWSFHVTNNKMLDWGINDRNYWNSATSKWYESGRSFRDIDKVEGTPNPWFQKLLDHPEQDDYWNALAPFENEYSDINIPVLSINGYYDDGHISSLYYLNQHLKYNENAEHYWLIGPYNHFFSQSKTIRGYKKDAVATIYRDELAFEWFDYVLKGKKKPDLIKDKINFQLMGDNSWQHAASMQELNSKHKRYYLNTIEKDGYHQLTEKAAAILNALTQTVDLADRTSSTNTDSYPWPIIKNELEDKSGFVFATPIFEQDTSVHGSFSGELKVKINKKDFDFGLTFYELTPEGKLFSLSFYIARASFATENGKRNLLTPGKIETIPFSDTRMTGKLFKKGSRLVVVVNVNKNQSAQVNFGTGKDVNDESNADGKEPLEVLWYNTSFINVPMKVIPK